MKLVAIPVLLVAFVAVAAEVGQPSSITIMRKGSQPAVVGAHIQQWIWAFDKKIRERFAL